MTVSMGGWGRTALQVFSHSQNPRTCTSPWHGSQLSSGRGERGKEFQGDLSTEHIVSAQRVSAKWTNPVREPSVIRWWVRRKTGRKPSAIGTQTLAPLTLRLQRLFCTRHTDGSIWHCGRQSLQHVIFSPIYQICLCVVLFKETQRENKLMVTGGELGEEWVKEVTRIQSALLMMSPE